MHFSQLLHVPIPVQNDTSHIVHPREENLTFRQHTFRLYNYPPAPEKPDGVFYLQNELLYPQLMDNILVLSPQYPQSKVVNDLYYYV